MFQLFIKSWADAHANLPLRARWYAKADVAPRSNEAEAQSALHKEGFLLPESAIPTALLQAYGATHYRVRDGRHDFTLQIGKYSQEMAELFQQKNSASAVFITADNPFSEVTSDLNNAASNGVLLDRLKHLAVAVYAGAGQDAEGKWPAEMSYLALGISRLQAATLGIQFRQNAVVWVDQDAIPELVLLR